MVMIFIGSCIVPASFLLSVFISEDGSSESSTLFDLKEKNTQIPFSLAVKVPLGNSPFWNSGS